MLSKKRSFRAGPWPSGFLGAKNILLSVATVHPKDWTLCVGRFLISRDEQLAPIRLDLFGG